jgi:hypothetical protein
VEADVTSSYILDNLIVVVLLSVILMSCFYVWRAPDENGVER